MVMACGTDDAFDLVAELLDELKRKYPHSDNPLCFDNDALVDFSKGTFPKEIALSVLILSVLQRLHTLLLNYIFDDQSL